MNDSQKNFRTLKGYGLHDKREITFAMEDYVEMIYRICLTKQYVRIKELAAMLNVRPSSCSKMAQSLKEAGLVDYEKYGVIKLSMSGGKLGKYLIHRHNVLQRFFCKINNSEGELEQVEQIEHFINKKTLDNIEKLLKTMESQSSE